MRMAPSYLTGHEAISVARMTGLLVTYARTYHGEPADVGPDAAEDAILRGVWAADDVMIDMTRLSWWDRWRVTWARIGAWRWLETHLSPDDLLAMVGE